MSTWTHVTGSIRYDGLQSMRLSPVNRHPEEFVRVDVPEGSEGPIGLDVWTNPERDHMAAYCVTFRGDLRDRGDEFVSELIEYFDRISKDQFVRGGVIKIDVELGRTVFLNCTPEGATIVAELLYVAPE